jgi:hypothetical protein
MTEQDDTPLYTPDSFYRVFRWQDLGLCIGVWFVLAFVVAFV